MAPSTSEQHNDPHFLRALQLEQSKDPQDPGPNEFGNWTTFGPKTRVEEWHKHLQVNPAEHHICSNAHLFTSMRYVNTQDLDNNGQDTSTRSAPNNKKNKDKSPAPENPSPQIHGIGEVTIYIRDENRRNRCTPLHLDNVYYIPIAPYVDHTIAHSRVPTSAEDFVTVGKIINLHRLDPETKKPVFQVIWETLTGVKAYSLATLGLCGKYVLKLCRSAHDHRDGTNGVRGRTVG